MSFIVWECENCKKQFTMGDGWYAYLHYLQKEPRCCIKRSIHPLGWAAKYSKDGSIPDPACRPFVGYNCYENKDGGFVKYD